MQHACTHTTGTAPEVCSISSVHTDRQKNWKNHWPNHGFRQKMSIFLFPHQGTLAVGLEGKNRLKTLENIRSTKTPKKPCGVHFENPFPQRVHLCFSRFSASLGFKNKKVPIRVDRWNRTNESPVFFYAALPPVGGGRSSRAHQWKVETPLYPRSIFPTEQILHLKKIARRFAPKCTNTQHIQTHETIN